MSLALAALLAAAMPATAVIPPDFADAVLLVSRSLHLNGDTDIVFGAEVLSGDIIAKDVGGWVLIEKQATAAADVRAGRDSRLRA